MGKNNCVEKVNSFLFSIFCIVVINLNSNKCFLKSNKKSYLITLKIAFSAKLVDLQVRVGILPEIGLITSIV